MELIGSEVQDDEREISGVSEKPFGLMQPARDDEDEALEVAIIGFWEMNA